MGFEQTISETIARPEAPARWQFLSNCALEEQLPAEVLKLAPREREVASTIYRHGALTAIELARYMHWHKAHGSLRMMLHRLVAKGILVRRHSGYGKTFLYVPALATKARAELAFSRLAEDFYDGSHSAAATDILHFLAQRARLAGDAQQAKRES